MRGKIKKDLETESINVLLYKPGQMTEVARESV